MPVIRTAARAISTCESARRPSRDNHASRAIGRFMTPWAKTLYRGSTHCRLISTARLTWGRCPRPCGTPPEYFRNNEGERRPWFFGAQISPPEASRVSAISILPASCAISLLSPRPRSGAWLSRCRSCALRRRPCHRCLQTSPRGALRAACCAMRRWAVSCRRRGRRW